MQGRGQGAVHRLVRARSLRKEHRVAPNDGQSGVALDRACGVCGGAFGRYCDKCVSEHGQRRHGNTNVQINEVHYLLIDIERCILSLPISEGDGDGEEEREESPDLREGDKVVVESEDEESEDEDESEQPLEEMSVTDLKIMIRSFEGERPDPRCTDKQASGSGARSMASGWAARGEGGDPLLSTGHLLL